MALFCFNWTPWCGRGEGVGLWRRVMCDSHAGLGAGHVTQRYTLQPEQRWPRCLYCTLLTSRTWRHYCLACWFSGVQIYLDIIVDSCWLVYSLLISKKHNNHDPVCSHRRHYRQTLPSHRQVTSKMNNEWWNSGKYIYLNSGYSFEFGPPAVRNILARVRPSLAQEVKWVLLRSWGS